MSSEPEDIALWLLAAVGAYPYLARGFGAMTPVDLTDEPGCPPMLRKTVAVDKAWRVYYTREGLETLAQEMNRADVMLHELSHLLRDHAARGVGLHPMLWNIAADMEINDEIDSLNCSPAMYPGMIGMAEDQLAEIYYEELMNKAGSAGEAAQELSGKGETCGGGSGVDGKPVPWEIPSDDPHTPGVSSGVEAEAMRDAVAGDVRTASRQQGVLPAGLTAWANARSSRLVRPPDWRAQLRGSLRGLLVSGAEDWSFARMSRRGDDASLPHITLPAAVRYQPDVAMVIDTSGSVCSDAGTILAVVDSVLSRAGVQSLTVAECDAAVARTRVIRQASALAEARGGGGTDLCVGIEALDRKNRVTIVVTDGDTPWPRKVKGKVIVVLVAGDRVIPSFMKKIIVSAK